MTHPLLELGGTGALVHMAPANGFPLPTYLPALSPLLDRFRVVSLPPRALWPDVGPPPAQPGNWELLADDLLEGIARHKLPAMIGIGHSFGAVATMLAAIREPKAFRALVFLDPTIFPPAMMATAKALRESGDMSFRPLVQAARKRRDRFASHQEAFHYWRPKPLFGDWSDAALTRYVEGMLRPTGAGDFTLTWPALWEAYYYESFRAESWNDLALLDQSIPLLAIAGGTTDTFSAESVALFRKRMPRAEVQVVPGHGHLFPQSAPEATGRILQDWIARLG